MRLFPRRSALPVDVRDQLTLAPGERLLAWAPAGTGWVVATTHAVWLPARSRHERLGWEAVDAAGWNTDEALLTLVQAAPLGSRPRRWAVRVEDAGDLLLVVKERVRATVVLSRRVDVDGGGVTVVARRPPGTDRITWTVSVDRGVDVADPATRDEIDRVVRRLKEQVGG